MRKKSEFRRCTAVSAVLMLALFLLPLAVVTPFRSALFSSETPVTETEGAPLVTGDRDGQVMLRVLNGDTVEEMSLGAYLVGVLRAEMPASFAPEALKAQAVAARTYTFYKIRTGGSHGDTAQICTDPACCQAYLAEDRARANWGASADTYEEKVRQAVRGTDGEVLLYGGEPILAVFHSSSAGQTRAAGEVWVTDLPYLQAVASPEDGDRIPNYYSRAAFSEEEFRRRVLAAYPQADLSGGAEGWLRDAVCDDAGSVETVLVGGVQVKGAALRSILGLRSACFDWETRDGEIVFFTTGYGHGVGMSQYGADRMAREGSSYREILTHYYTGVTIGTCAAFTNGAGT